MTGKHFVDLLHERVLGPLELNSTWYLPDEPEAGSFVSGCVERDGVLCRTDYLSSASLVSHCGASAGLVSTAEDLSDFGLRVLRGHELLSERLAAEAFSIGPGGTGLGVLGVSDAAPRHHPFPIFAAGSRAAEFVGFGGSGMLPGVSTKLVYLPRVDTLIVLLLNRSSPPGGTEYLREMIGAFSGAVAAP